MNTPTRRETLRMMTCLAAAVALDHATAHAAAEPGTVTPIVPPAGAPAAADSENGYAVGHSSNFHAIYQDPKLKAAFLLFLTNVYHLYPENDFHQLIAQAVHDGQTDRQIYALVQSRLNRVKPFLADLRYSLPALAKQKTEMARETLSLLGPHPSINGYMEIGTTGRYISRLKDNLSLSGDLVLVNILEPSYTPIDIAERGQLSKLGRFVSLHDYAPISPADVPDRSLDVVANYIGFHHSPPEKRDAFVRSVARVLRPGGRLILRDHDVNSDDMNRMVALAHDVFNMGLGVPWQTNQREIRNFTSLAAMVTYLEGFGLKSVPALPVEFQGGDPTHNALMSFVKV